MATPGSGKVALVLGASRGIGRQVAIDLAKNGYKVVVSAKSTSDPSKTRPFPPDPNSAASTISTVALEIQRLGLAAHPIPCDTRSPSNVESLISQTIATCGRLDVLIYNSGAIWRFRLMQQVNPEGLYAAIQAALPHFRQENGQWEGRIVVVSPPIYSRFFRGKAAYAMGKVGMSVLTKGLAMDFEREGKTGMAITSIWPAAAVDSAATAGPGVDRRDLRHPAIFSDAILAMLAAPTSEVNGLLDLDEDFLRKKGVSDFSKYSIVPGTTPRRIMPAEFPDLAVAEQDDEGKRMDSTKIRRSKI